MYHSRGVWLVAAEWGLCVLLTTIVQYHDITPIFHLPSAAQRSFFRGPCCLVAFQTLFYPSLNLFFVSFPLFYPPVVSYAQQPATTLSIKCRKCFVRGSLKLFLINLCPVLMSFVASNLAGIESWIFTATPLMFLSGLIKCRWTEWRQVTLSTSPISEVIAD